MWTVVVGCAALALAAAGCSAPPAGPRVATAAPATSGPAAAASPGPSASAVLTDYDKALAYTRCMTAHGVRMADPVEGTMLELGGAVRMTPGGDAQADLARYQAAQKAFPVCRHLLPDTWPVKADPAEVARSRAFGQCLKARGLPVQEPDANGYYHTPTDTSFQATPEFEAGVRACRHLYDDQANTSAGNRD